MWLICSGIPPTALAITGRLFHSASDTVRPKPSFSDFCTYLTVSEIFPLEIRAMAIAVFYSAGTGVGGIVAPWFFGMLIDTGSRQALFGGYMIAVALMLTAAIVEAVMGVAAERMSLEQIAAPLSSLD